LHTRIYRNTVKTPENRNQYAEWKETKKKEDRDPQEEKAVAQGPSQEEETLIALHHEKHRTRVYLAGTGDEQELQ
jgi:hypothetical protein